MFWLLWFFKYFFSKKCALIVWAHTEISSDLILKKTSKFQITSTIQKRIDFFEEISKDHSRIICSGKTLKLCKTYRIFYHVPLLLRWWWPHRHIQPQKTLFWCFPKSWHPNHSCYPFDIYIILPIGKMFLVNIALYLLMDTFFCLKVLSKRV